MSNLLFPHLYGLSWDMKEGLVGSTNVQEAQAPGFETRLANGPDVLSRFALQYVVLDDGLKYDSLNKFAAFFRARRGKFDSFLLSLNDVTKTTHGTLAAQVLTPEAGGYTPIVRALGTSGEVERIFELAGVNGNPGAAPVLKMGGVALTPGTDYTIQGPGVAVSGKTYPGLVAVISHAITGTVTIDGSWYYRVRFEQDAQEFSMFHYLLWNAEEVKLTEVRS